MLLTSVNFVLCFLAAAAYMAFGVLQMVVPAKAVPIYRFFLGKRRFAQAEPHFAALSRGAWKFLGAGFVLIGLAVVVALMRALEHRVSR